MSLFYRIAYAMGFTPWEAAGSHPPARNLMMAALDREESGRNPPLGAALDLGCGSGHWTIELARRGWQATGIDNVPKALARARARPGHPGVRFVEGDVAALRCAGIGDGVGFFLDGGTLHGLDRAGFAAAAHEIDAVAAPDATMLMLAWTPASRGPLPRGVDRAEIEQAFAGWRVVDERPFDVTGLPPPLRSVGPKLYRLARAA